MTQDERAQEEQDRMRGARDRAREEATLRLAAARESAAKQADLLER